MVVRKAPFWQVDERRRRCVRAQRLLRAACAGCCGLACTLTQMTTVVRTGEMRWSGVLNPGFW